MASLNRLGEKDDPEQGNDWVDLSEIGRAPPTRYEQIVSALESARDFMGGPPTVAGSLGLMLSAIPAGRGAMVPHGRMAMPEPPPVQPTPDRYAPRGWDGAAFTRAEDLRRQMGVSARDAGGRQTDAALKAIEEALKYAPPKR